MSITAAVIESSGWVLRLTVTGALTQPNTNFGAYIFDYDGVPRLSLAVSHPGFVKSAGAAVAGALARNIVGLRPLRQVVNPASPTVKVLDEVNLGGGLLQVRIALSETIYATETSLSLSTLAGWRSGIGAQSGLSVINNSTATPPVPIMRWVLPHYGVATGPFRISLIVGSHHPVGFDPVAGVKFTVTDGTTVKTFWTTALATDNTYGDNLRCYSMVVDPSTATALTAGLLRCDAEVYPYLGSMRTTDPAGTRSMTNIRTDGFLTTAQAPWVIGYDPAGTRYSNRFVVVDPVNGTTTPSGAMVQPTLAAAKAVASTSKPRDISTAVAAGRNQSYTLPAANGQPSSSSDFSGLRVIVPAGVYNGLGSTIPNSGNCAEIPVTIEGDPDDPDARNNVILDTETTGRNIRTTRLRYRRLTVRAAASQFLNTNTVAYVWLDNITLQGKAGSEASTTNPFSTAAGVPATQFAWTVTNSRIWRLAMQIGANTRQIMLFRANEHTSKARATVIVKNRVIPPAEDGITNYSSTFNQVGYANPQQTVNIGHFEDWVVAYNDARSIRWEGLGRTPIPAALAGTSKDQIRRHLILNNVFERVSGTFTPNSDTDTTQGGYGENEHVVMRDIIVEGNTFAGAGLNAFYNDPLPVTLADTDSQNNEAYNIRNANNAYDRQASKQDEFNDDTTRNIRRANGFPTADGHRPQLVGVWSTHFGTDAEAIVDSSRAESGPGNFLKDGLGPRSVQFQPKLATVGWANDACERGSDQGLGDYTPMPGSPLLGRIIRGNSDRDWLGNPRLFNGAAGAIEAGGQSLVAQGARHDHAATAPALAVPLTLAAQNGNHGHSAAATTVSTGVSLVTANAAQQHRAAVSQASWATSLFAANALMTSAAVMAVVAWQGSIIPSGANSAIGSTSPPISSTGPVATVLAPPGALHVMLSQAAQLFPESSVPEDRTLRVRADARTIFITETKQEN
jgi:hypothetical protein